MEEENRNGGGRTRLEIIYVYERPVSVARIVPIPNSRHGVGEEKMKSFFVIFHRIM